MHITSSYHNLTRILSSFHYLLNMVLNFHFTLKITSLQKMIINLYRLHLYIIIKTNNIIKLFSTFAPRFSKNFALITTTTNNKTLTKFIKLTPKNTRCLIQISSISKRYNLKQILKTNLIKSNSIKMKCPTKLINLILTNKLIQINNRLIILHR